MIFKGCCRLFRPSSSDNVDARRVPQITGGGFDCITSHNTRKVWYHAIWCNAKSIILQLVSKVWVSYLFFNSDPMNTIHHTNVFVGLQYNEWGRLGVTSWLATQHRQIPSRNRLPLLLLYVSTEMPSCRREY